MQIDNGNVGLGKRVEKRVRQDRHPARTDYHVWLISKDNSGKVFIVFRSSVVCIFFSVWYQIAVKGISIAAVGWKKDKKGSGDRQKLTGNA